MPNHDRLSDTQLFVQTVLNPLRPGFQDSVDVRAVLEHLLGWSKVVLLSGDGSAVILNERLGSWHHNIWYSNDTYRKWSVEDVKEMEGVYEDDDRHSWDDKDEPEWVRHYRPYCVQKPLPFKSGSTSSITF